MGIDLSSIVTPYGLLDEMVRAQLRAHGGPYELWSDNGWVGTQPMFHPTSTYRVKPSPKVETISMSVFIDRQGFIQPSHLSGLTTRVQVNFTRIDGVIDLSSYRVSAR